MWRDEGLYDLDQLLLLVMYSVNLMTKAYLKEMDGTFPRKRGKWKGGEVARSARGR